VKKSGSPDASKVSRHDQSTQYGADGACSRFCAEVRGTGDRAKEARYGSAEPTAADSRTEEGLIKSRRPKSSVGGFSLSVEEVMAFMVNSAPGAGFRSEPSATFEDPQAALEHARSLGARGMRLIKIRDTVSGTVFDERQLRLHIENLPAASHG
jgi:hypothetical protein